MMRIGAVVSVIAKDEVFVLEQHQGAIGIGRLLVDIGLVKWECIAVDIGYMNLAVLYLHHLPG